MTQITTNGETKISLVVLSSDELQKTIDNMISFMKELPLMEMVGWNERDVYDGSSNIVANLKTEKDFDDFNIEDMMDLKTFVQVVGLDNYDSYTIAEYAYMYTQVLENI